MEAVSTAAGSKHGSGLNPLQVLTWKRLSTAAGSNMVAVATAANGWNNMEAVRTD